MRAQNIENNTPKVRSVRTLRQWIQQGQLPAGEQLPPENELAHALNVSRSTLRAAVKLIEEEGLLQYKENRRRVVVGTTKKTNTLLSQTVAILTNMNVDQPVDRNAISGHTGWERFVQIGLIDAIQDAGMHALTLRIDLLQKNLIKSLTKEGLQGLVVMRPALQPSATIELAEALREQGVPVVFYGFTDLAKFDTVASDSASGCYDLTKWLISKGRRRILRVWPAYRDGMVPEWRRQRDLGYERAIAECGLESLTPVEFPVLPEPETYNQAHFQSCVRLLVGHLFEYFTGPNPIDAIMAISDGDSLSLAAACRTLGKEPGKDVSIVGYDNYWKECPERELESFIPDATVDKLNISLGHELMALLLARCNGELPPEPQQRLIRPELRIPVE